MLPILSRNSSTFFYLVNIRTVAGKVILRAVDYQQLRTLVVDILELEIYPSRTS